MPLAAPRPSAGAQETIVQRRDEEFDRAADERAKEAAGQARMLERAAPRDARGVAQSGSARALGARRRGFKSRLPDHIYRGILGVSARKRDKSRLPRRASEGEAAALSTISPSASGSTSVARPTGNETRRRRNARDGPSVSLTSAGPRLKLMVCELRKSHRTASSALGPLRSLGEHVHRLRGLRGGGKAERQDAAICRSCCALLSERLRDACYRPAGH